MKKAKACIVKIGVLILSLTCGSMSGNIYSRAGLVSDQTTTKSAQTTSKSAQTKSTTVQTKPKPVQTTSTSAQTKPTSTQTKSASTQTKSTSTQTKSTTTQKKTTSTQAKSKSAQTKPASGKAVTKPAVTARAKEAGTITIGTQIWAVANLNVVTFRNGDSIPEAKTYKEWVAAGEAGKPAWCYYDNNLVNGQKYGRLYNWYAVNDPRGLAPVGWSVPGDEDWAKLTTFLGGQAAAGEKMKSAAGWLDGNNGTNESGFNGLPGGYRVENGIFRDIGSIGTWWSSTESKPATAFDFYVILSNSSSRSSSPKQRGAYVRCIKK